MKTLIDYTFNAPRIANPDGSASAMISGAKVGAGPGDTPLGRFDKSLELGQRGKGVVDLAGVKPDLIQFSVQMAFMVAGPVTSKQTLAESDLLPFRLFVDRGTTSANLTLHAQVKPDGSEWAGATTGFTKDLLPNTWYTASFVYDYNTIGLFVDGDLVAVYAFPRGLIKTIGGTRLFIGTGADGKNHFSGAIAALRWEDGVSDALLDLVDERRSAAEWFITYKYEALRGLLALGEPIGAMTFDVVAEAYTQRYAAGAIQYHDGVGAAFEMHGAIDQTYMSMARKADLGYLVSDEGDSARAGGRKSIFSKGTIYWSRATGAVRVLEQIYLAYEAMGESGSILGFPTNPPAVVPGGLEQVFQGGRMYHKEGSSSAHEVHGAILARYLALGGVRTLGFPITDELDLKKKSASIGKNSEFDGCTFYWSPSTGAHQVQGDIRRKYRDETGGPAGALGFPTSDEMDVPGVSGPGRFNTFQQGSIVWFGSWSTTTVALPFTVYVGRIDSKESEGLLMGENDIYTRVTLKEGASTLYERRHPSSGDWAGRNIVDLDLNIPSVIVPDDTGKTVKLIVDVWESDDGAPFGGGDDHLGTWTKNLSIANAWGFTENGGILNSGSFSDINDITASVKPQVDAGSLSETQKFWGVRNKGTPTITRAQYASAFVDVDSDSEWWDVTDWLEKAFYELVVDSLAEHGNCFGMSLEAINARKGVSLFGLPLDRFTDWEQVRKEFNIKHCYQVGSGPIWWFLGEFITGNTHDPKDVFDRTWQEASRGNNPVLCVAQNYDFSGHPHCILPVGWDKSSKPWRMTICDPNSPKKLKELTVNPDKNTFRYVGSHTYEGGEWTGGRMHYMPYDLLCSPPHTPIWDAILLILAGTILILGEDAQTASITDLDGNDLDAFGERARKRLKTNQRLDGFFVGLKGFDRSVPRDDQLVGAGDAVVDPGFRPRAKGTIAGELLVRRFASSREAIADPTLSDSVIAHASIGALVEDRRFRPLAEAVARQPAALRGLRDRTIAHVANDPRTMSSLDPDARRLLGRLAGLNRTNDFAHTIEAIRPGSLDYTVKRGLSEINLRSSVGRVERTEIQMRNPGTSKQAITVKAARDKDLTLQIRNKLGVGRDRLGITVTGIPLTAGGAPVEINARPGLGGIDVVAGGQKVSADVVIDAEVGGRRVQRSFAVPLEEGVRVSPSSVLAEGTLDISRIDRLFGPPLSRQRIKRNP